MVLDIIRIIGIVVGALAALYVLTCFLIAYGFAFRGKGQPVGTPADYGVSFEDVTFFSSDGVELCAWYIPGASNVTVVVMHGGRAHREDNEMGLLEISAELARRGYNVLNLDRRGCGFSAHTAFKNRAHLERDFDAAVNFIRERFNGYHQIFLFGNSVGALAALLYQVEHKPADVRGIIVDSVFTTKTAIANRVMDAAMPGLRVFASLALWFGEKLFGVTHRDPLDLVPEIGVPILFINGNLDDAIPESAAYELKEASNNPLDEVFVVPGAEHSKTYRTLPEMFLARLAAFFEKHRDPLPDKTSPIIT